MIRDIFEKVSQERIAFLGEMDMAAINTEIEILKIKIIYWRKITILQSLRRENSGEKF
jgi:hypothetical protein